MSGGEGTPAGPHPAHGQVVYLQLPAADVTASAALLEAVFGWSVDAERGRFEAPGVIGEWTTARPPSRDAGPVVWILAEQLWPSSIGSTPTAGASQGGPSSTVASATSPSATTPR